MFRFAFLVFFKPGCGSVRFHLKRVAIALSLLQTHAEQFSESCLCDTSSANCCKHVTLNSESISLLSALPIRAACIVLFALCFVCSNPTGRRHEL